MRIVTQVLPSLINNRVVARKLGTNLTLGARVDSSDDLVRIGGPSDGLRPSIVFHDEAIDSGLQLDVLLHKILLQVPRCNRAF